MPGGRAAPCWRNNGARPDRLWHLDVVRKTFDIYRKRDFTWDQIYNGMAAQQALVHDLYRIEDATLPIFKKAQPNEPIAA